MLIIQFFVKDLFLYFSLPLRLYNVTLMLDFKRYRWMKILPFLFDTIFILFKMYTTPRRIYTPLTVDVQNSYSSASLKRQTANSQKTIIMKNKLAPFRIIHLNTAIFNIHLKGSSTVLIQVNYLNLAELRSNRVY